MGDIDLTVLNNLHKKYIKSWRHVIEIDNFSKN
jgi:hypothetical protein